MNDNNDIIKQNIEEIKLKVENAAKKSGRSIEDIKIIAVTKTVDIDSMIKAFDEGLTTCGESKVQEFTHKYDTIKRDCEWHFIGHLQTNKVKYIIDKIDFLHSLDSLELAKELQKKAEKINRIINVLVQVNVAGEESKFGIPPEQAVDFIKQVSLNKNLKVKGLMTIAPYTENPEEVRPVFKSMRKIFIDITQENIDNIDMAFLSMGMSNDFEVAIEEGANMVRIGTAIFGERQYT
ncbi:MAG: YggS family pyridoxal phosphate-dependent enzyme [Clostridia bacterium]|nr:YggS family pyridoxal phosphate-dependent enzyme [Clostridia bacterium]